MSYLHWRDANLDGMEDSDLIPFIELLRVLLANSDVKRRPQLVVQVQAKLQEALQQLDSRLTQLALFDAGAEGMAIVTRDIEENGAYFPPGPFFFDEPGDAPTDR